MSAPSISQVLIFMQAWDMKRGQEVLQEIRASSEGMGKLERIEMELDSFKSVSAGAVEFLNRSPELIVLVNNAGE